MMMLFWRAEVRIETFWGSCFEGLLDMVEI